MVATSNSSGVVKLSSVCASGYASASSRLIRRARRTRAIRDSDFGATGPSLLILGPAGTTARRRAGGGEEAGDHAAGTCRPMTTTATARAPARLSATAADWALAPD